MADVTINELTAQAPATSDVFPYSTTGVTPSTYKASLTQIKTAMGLATVATTGSYADLINKPTIGLGGMQAFTVTGIFTVPASVTRVKVTAIGAGGGGGGPWSTTPGYVGGAGGVAIGTVTVTPSTSYVISVGGGGSAGSIYGGGGGGGTSQFGDQALITATGGTGGARATQGGPGTAGTGINGAFNSSSGSFMPGYGGAGAPSSAGQSGLVLIEW